MPKRSVDHTGARFGKLTVIYRDSGSGRPRWRCRCDCGNETIVAAHELTRSNRPPTRSCGCLRIEASTTHGQVADRKQSPEYQSWRGMWDRCTNPKHKSYARYGARGITVCERWRTFEYFLADMGYRPAGTSIDRIDNDRGYELGNCRWATRSEQRANQQEDQRLIEFCGEKLSRREWSKRLGISKAALGFRLKNWPLADALTMDRKR